MTEEYTSRVSAEDTGEVSGMNTAENTIQNSTSVPPPDRRAFIGGVDIFYDHSGEARKELPASKCKKSGFQVSFRDFQKVDNGDVDPFSCGTERASVQCDQNLNIPNEPYGEFPIEYQCLTDKENREEFSIMNNASDISPLHAEELQEHVRSEKETQAATNGESTIRFQCSFKRDMHEQKNTPVQWPSAHATEANGIDEGLIDQVFSTTEYSCISRSPQQCSSREPFPFEAHEKQCPRISSDVPHAAPVDSPHADQVVALDRMHFDGTPPNTLSALQSIETIHGTEWRNLPVNEIVSSLQSISRVPVGGFSSAVEGAIVHNCMSEAAKHAEEKHSWIDAFLFASVGNDGDIQHVIRKYIQANSGEIHPLMHYALAFDYLSCDHKGVCAYWPFLLKLVVTGMEDTNNPRNLIDKLMRALSLAGKHEESSICTVVCRSMKNHEFLPDVAIEKDLTELPVYVTGNGEELNPPDVSQKSIAGSEAPRSNWDAANEAQAWKSSALFSESPSHVQCAEPNMRINAQEDVILQPSESPDFSFSDTIGLIDPIETPMGGNWWH